MSTDQIRDRSGKVRQKKTDVDVLTTEPSR